MYVASKRVEALLRPGNREIRAQAIAQQGLLSKASQGTPSTAWIRVQQKCNRLDPAQFPAAWQNAKTF